MIRYFLVAIAISISGCVSFQPNEKERGVAFPLEICNEDILKLASSKLLADSETTFDLTGLTFSQKWVCRTNLYSSEKPESASEPELTLAELMALDNSHERELRKNLELPFLRKHDERPAVGIALSGGGVKASAFSTGVLAGLSDLGMLDTADFISSVSGGGYASYFYYAQKIKPNVRRNYSVNPPPTSMQLYSDCVAIPEDIGHDSDLLQKIVLVGGCEVGTLTPRVAPGQVATDNRYQAFLKCQQDIFRPGNCITGTPNLENSIHSSVYVGTLAAIVPAFISSTLFDWGNTISPAAKTYREGIGIAYGTSITNPMRLKEAEGKKRFGFSCTPQEGGYILGCREQAMNPYPIALTFDELRKGYQNAKKENSPLPFWIINAAAPKRRNAFGWVAPVPEELSNSDMFEMTAVSHGSGRYGYVSAPPSLYGMTVLDSVAASAAFLDANNLVLGPTIRGVLGFGMHLAALDWGQDIPNYNTGDDRRRLHRAMPIPFTWLDSWAAQYKPWRDGDVESQDRVRSVYIRLMDGGNAENLGAFSLVKRKVRTIIISDAAQDDEGRFDDICGFARRLSQITDGVAAKHFYLPGLPNLSKHCDHNLKEPKSSRLGYDLHNWPFSHPVLAGCLRQSSSTNTSNPCENLSTAADALDSIIYVVKPAVSNRKFLSQLSGASAGGKRAVKDCWVRGYSGNQPNSPDALNCDTAAYMAATWDLAAGDCQIFPQHSTVAMTINSNDRSFAAYRELARQYVSNSIIRDSGDQSQKSFNALIAQQVKEGSDFLSKPVGDVCRS